MLDSRKPPKRFPKVSMIAGVIAVPFWYLVLVSQGVASGVALGVAGFTLVVTVASLLIAWRWKSETKHTDS
jgi:hypothetical protein